MTGARSTNSARPVREPFAQTIARRKSGSARISEIRGSGAPVSSNSDALMEPSPHLWQQRHVVGLRCQISHLVAPSATTQHVARHVRTPVDDERCESWI